ncbi:MAG: calcineurin-like phosphoesterase C-terminal domain-containing protein [Prevotella sp.]
MRPYPTRIFSLLLLLAAAAGPSYAKDYMFSGRVVADGRGVKDVVVTNGVSFCLTDDKGRWTLETDTCVSKFVYISTPSGYNLPAVKSIAAFYVPASRLVADGGKHDFVLTKRQKPDKTFYFLPISDPQVKTAEHVKMWNSQTIPDLLNTSRELAKRHEVVTMTLGDIVWDNMKLFDDYRESMAQLPVTAFQCIGNHDFDKRFQALNNMPYSSPVYGEMAFSRHFGPTDYSFNIAGVHVVTLKNINYMGGRKYREQITEAQLEWLRRDLSYVPKGSMVILNMHAAAWNTQETEGNVINAASLAEALRGYKVHVFTGHTHFFQNNQPSPDIYEHNIGAACGAWWRGGVNRCGAPDGYMIVEASADTLMWKYKPTGDTVGKQMRLYGVGEFHTQPFEVVANVWDCDSATTVEWYEDGVCRGRMERFDDTDEAYLATLTDRDKRCLTTHLFRARPLLTTREVKVVVRNRFGETFTETISPHRAYYNLPPDSMPRPIAHRGYWRAPGCVQNSLAALKAAARAGIYGCELDVHATADGEIIVNHDPHIGGLPISTTPYAQLAKARLANGERIPTLASYLDEAGRHPQMKIILEIKDQQSDSANACLAAKAVKMVRERRMETQVEYISFSPYVCDRVLGEDSTAYVAYVGGKMTPKEAHERGYRCIDYSLAIFLKHPEWVSQAHALGLHVNIWTPDTEEEKRMARILRPDFMTTDEPVE